MPLLGVGVGLSPDSAAPAGSTNCRIRRSAGEMRGREAEGFCDHLGVIPCLLAAHGPKDGPRQRDVAIRSFIDDPR